MIRHLVEVRPGVFHLLLGDAGLKMHVYSNSPKQKPVDWARGKDLHREPLISRASQLSYPGVPRLLDG